MLSDLGVTIACQLLQKRRHHMHSTCLVQDACPNSFGSLEEKSFNYRKQAVGSTKVVDAPVIQGSMACRTSAPVRPMITPTRWSCSASVKYSANSGHSSCSSARTCCSRDARVAAVSRCSRAACCDASASVVDARIAARACRTAQFALVHRLLSTCQSGQFTGLKRPP